MNLTVELDREEDGRWIAEVAALPGGLAYGETREQALASAEALALLLLAERLEHGEQAPESFHGSNVFAERFPNVAQWVQAFGWIEIGRDDNAPSGAEPPPHR